MWNMSQQAAYQAQGLWPDPANVPDPQFNYVTMLLHGDGTNGAQNNTFLDGSSYAATVTCNGNTTQGSFSPYGSNWSNYFATNAYVTAPASTNWQFSGDFTIECWFYRDTSTSPQVFDVESAGSYLTLVINGTSGFNVYLNSSSVTMTVTDKTAAVGVWTHVALVRSGSTVKLYVNGSASSTTATNSSTLGYNQPFYFGGVGGAVYVSNARIVGAAVYTTTFTPSTTPLTAIANTRLLTCQSNRFVDNSSYAAALTLTGTPSVQRFNPFGTSTAYSTATIGGSAYFDGTGDYLTIADSAAFTVLANSMTCEAWVYPTSFATQSSIFGYWNSSSAANRNFLITIETTGAIRQYTYTTGAGLQSPTSTATLKLNAWNHVAYVKNGDTNTTYINGVSAATATSSGEMPDISIPFSVGATGNGVIVIPPAYISDVRFLNGTALYTANFTPPTAPLTAIANTVALMNMTNGAIYDNAMMNDLETVGNAQISTSVVKYGTGSLAFDGSGDYLSAPNIPPDTLGGGDFTIEMWINLASNTTQQTIITKGGQNPIAADANGWSLFIYSSTLYFFIRDGSGSGNLNNQFCSSGTWTAAVANNTWAHLAIVRSGTTITAYANGVSLGSLTSASNPVTTDPLIVGAAFSIANYMTGYIDDLRITKGYARYTTTFTPPTEAFPNIGPN